MKILNYIYKLYAIFCGRPNLVKLNKFLYNLSIRGLGILNYESFYLSGEFHWLRKYLNNIKEPFIIDIGAHHGNYVKLCLSANPRCNVIAIEAHPKNFEILKNNFNFNKQIVLINCALGDRSGKSTIFDYKFKNGSSHASLCKAVIEEFHGKEAVSHTIEIKTLPDILKEIGYIDKSIDLLKIDVEGYEYKVLLGAKELLDSRKVKVIQFEFNQMNIVTKVFFKDFWDLLSNNYYFFRLLPYGRLLPIPAYSPLYCEIYQYQNIICIQKNLKEIHYDF